MYLLTFSYVRTIVLYVGTSVVFYLGTSFVMYVGTRFVMYGGTRFVLEPAEYRAKEDPESGYDWVMKCFKRPRYFYKMFRMSTEVFMALHDLLVSSYGLKSSRNVTSI
jgi:hypothetical protein